MFLLQYFWLFCCWIHYDNTWFSNCWILASLHSTGMYSRHESHDIALYIEVWGIPPILLPNSIFSTHTSPMAPGVPPALFLRFFHSILPHTVQNVTKSCGNEASFHCVRNIPYSQKIWRGFNLVIWWSRRKSPHLIQPILNPAAPAAWYYM